MSFSAAIAAAQKVARAVNGGAIRYTRGDDYVDIDLAGRGNSQVQKLNSSGFITEIESRDFLIEAAALVLAGETILPEQGDKISETVGAATLTYELLDLGGEPPWRYSDTYRLQLRVHTKLIG